MAYSPSGNSGYTVSISVDFPSNSTNDTFFHRTALYHSRADWDGIFKPGTFTAASEFYEWLQVGTDVYIPHCKYLVKPHSSTWFSAACAAAIAHRNHFFRVYQHNKSPVSKDKFRQASNRYKWALEAAKLAYANKTKEFINLHKLDSRVFSESLIMFTIKGKSVNLLCIMGPKVLLSASDKAKLFSEIFSKNSNLDDSATFLFQN